MRRTLTAAVVAAALLAGCGGDGNDEATSTTEAEAGEPGDAVLQFLDRSLAGQWGPLYETLHPEHQALVTQDQYFTCSEQRRQDDPVVTTADMTIEVTDTYEETLTLPGTQVEANTLAVTVEISAQGEATQTTMHVVDVDGQWRWMLDNEQLTSCQAP